MFRKSKRSFSNSNCVEVDTDLGAVVAVRDSKDPGGPVLEFTRGEWTRFLGEIVTEFPGTTFRA
jgi:hypothetical protein